jgi:hypothetical protein
VMTSGEHCERIAGQFRHFREHLEEGRVHSSNLFAQLYYKQRLVQVLAQPRGLERLDDGVQFPSWSSKLIRKIGRNDVVLEATRRLQRHLDEVFYLAIVPDEPSAVAAPFQALRDPPHQSLAAHWDVST